MLYFLSELKYRIVGMYDVAMEHPVNYEYNSWYGIKPNLFKEYRPTFSQGGTHTGA